MSQWSPWTTCSATCGGGIQRRNRTVTVIVTRIVTVAHLVTPNHSHTNSSNHTGNHTHETHPNWVHNANGTFTVYKNETVTEVHQSANQTDVPAGCGSLVEERTCADNLCPVDCVVGAWTEWSKCSSHCGGGVSMRTRPILTPNSQGGAACPQTTQWRNCNMEPCSQSCKVSEWGNFSDCSVPCGERQRLRRSRRSPVLTCTSPR
jgi:hypothetical protein